MSLLDLLSAFTSPELSVTERGELRSILAAERARAQARDAKPWESGLVAGTLKTREQLLEDRVEDLELALKVLSDILAERGFLDRGSLPARVAQLKRDLASEEDARESAARQRQAEQRKAANEAPVTCVACTKVVTARESFASSRGPLCASCHHDQE